MGASDYSDYDACIDNDDSESKVGGVEPQQCSSITSPGSAADCPSPCTYSSGNPCSGTTYTRPTSCNNNVCTF